MTEKICFIVTAIGELVHLPESEPTMYISILSPLFVKILDINLFVLTTSMRLTTSTKRL